MISCPLIIPAVRIENPLTCSCFFPETSLQSWPAWWIAKTSHFILSIRGIYTMVAAHVNNSGGYAANEPRNEESSRHLLAREKDREDTFAFLTTHCCSVSIRPPPGSRIHDSDPWGWWGLLVMWRTQVVVWWWGMMQILASQICHHTISGGINYDRFG